jgi:hypothetical protein
MSLRPEPLERKVMKSQEWKGFVVGIFASLGLILSAGAGVARAQVTPQLEASFNLPTEEGVARDTIAPQVEASFDLPTEEGVAAIATAAPQVEASFDLPPEEGVAVHATITSPSAVQVGLRTEELEEKD